MYYPTAMMPAHAARAGYDAVWLDNEHNGWECREIQRFLGLHRLADIDCIVRTGSRSATELYRLLEDGATALMIPLVSSVEEVKKLVNAVKFAPLGQRGVDGAGVDNDFYLHGVEGYFKQANEETLLIVQIETTEGLAAIDEIAAVPGLDALFIGPGDLSLRLECPVDWSHPRMKNAQARVAAAAARHGIAWGRPARSVEDIRDLAAAGAQLICHGSDFSCVSRMLPNFQETFNQALGAPTDNKKPLTAERVDALGAE